MARKSSKIFVNNFLEYSDSFKKIENYLLTSLDSLVSQIIQYLRMFFILIKKVIIQIHCSALTKVKANANKRFAIHFI